MSILITGTNSFIGKHYKRYSQFTDIEEVDLINTSPNEIDFRSVDIVIHLAGLVHQKKMLPDQEYFKINKDLAIKTAKEAKKAGVKHFIFMSTLSVYGEFPKNVAYLDEFSLCKPINVYGKSKLEAEYGLKKLNDSYFCVSIIRTPIVYGEDVKANMQSLIKLVRKLPILPLGNIHNKRSFTAVENLTRYFDLIIEKRISGIFIASDPKPISTTELLNLISKGLGKKVLLIEVPKLVLKLIYKLKPKLMDRLFGSFVVNNSFTIKQLDYKPKISTQDAVEKMTKSYISNIKK